MDGEKRGREILTLQMIRDEGGCHASLRLDSTWSRPGGTLTGVSVRMFPERFNGEGKINPECGGHNPMGFQNE